MTVIRYEVIECLGADKLMRAVPLGFLKDFVDECINAGLDLDTRIPIPDLRVVIPPENL